MTRAISDRARCLIRTFRVGLSRCIAIRPSAAPRVAPPARVSQDRGNTPECGGRSRMAVLRVRIGSAAVARRVGRMSRRKCLSEWSLPGSNRQPMPCKAIPEACYYGSLSPQSHVFRSQLHSAARFGNTTRHYWRQLRSTIVNSRNRADWSRFGRAARRRSPPSMRRETIATAGGETHGPQRSRSERLTAGRSRSRCRQSTSSETLRRPCVNIRRWARIVSPNDAD